MQYKGVRYYLEKYLNDSVNEKALKMYDDLLDDFLYWPASVKYHHKDEGGLSRHTEEVICYGLRLFNSFEEDYKKKFAGTKPYEEGFDELKNSAGLDILETIKKRKEELASNIFPAEYRQFNSLMYPSNFIGGEQ